MKVVNNIRIGKPDVDRAAPSHVAGVREGNASGGIERNPGFYTDADSGKTRTTMARAISPNGLPEPHPRMRPPPCD